MTVPNSVLYLTKKPCTIKISILTKVENLSIVPGKTVKNPLNKPLGNTIEHRNYCFIENSIWYEIDIASKIGKIIRNYAVQMEYQILIRKEAVLTITFFMISKWYTTHATSITAKLSHQVIIT